MTHVDFRNVRDNVQIDRVAAWLGIKLTRRFMGEQLRAECPIHGGGKRALVITPSKNAFYCFAPECRKGGDAIELTAKVRRISAREAALALQAHFLDYHRKIGTADNPLHKIDYLQHEHEAVQALGISADVARMLGIGYAPKGTMIKRVLFPMRSEDGKLVGYIGYGRDLDPQVKLPKTFHV
jgi:DNA primase